MSEGAVLITGATGYLGTHLVREYLERTSLTVVLAVRARSWDDFNVRRRSLAASWGGVGTRIRFVPDFTWPVPFEGVRPTEIVEIVHAAGATQLNAGRDVVWQANVNGTRQVCAFAARCPSLRALGYVSTVYASGLRAGTISETACEAQAEFANAYEWSKNQAESVVTAPESGLPWRVFRVATIVADDSSGRVVQQNAFHNTMRLLRYGLLSMVPGDPGTPLYFVPADFAARAIVRLMQVSPAGTVYHVSHSRADAPTLGGLIDLCFEAFSRDPDFARRRVRKPLFCDQRSFGLLREGVVSFGSSVLIDAIASVAPFAPQLFIHKSIENGNLRRDAGADIGLPLHALLENTCAWMVRSGFGRSRGVSHAR